MPQFKLISAKHPKFSKQVSESEYFYGRFHENFCQTDGPPAVMKPNHFFAFWCFNSLQTQQVTQDANTSSLSFLQITSGIPYSSPASISEVFRRVVNIFGSKQTIKSILNC